MTSPTSGTLDPFENSSDGDSYKMTRITLYFHNHIISLATQHSPDL